MAKWISDKELEANETAGATESSVKWTELTEPQEIVVVGFASAAKWTEVAGSLVVRFPSSAKWTELTDEVAGADAESVAGTVPGNVEGDEVEGAPPAGPLEASGVPERTFTSAGDRKSPFLFSDELLVHQQSKHVGTQITKTASKMPEAMMPALLNVAC